MKNKNQLVSFVFFALVMMFAATIPGTFAQSGDGDNSKVGTVERVDPATKTVYVRTNDDVVTAFVWTAKTTAHGIKVASLWTAHEAHVGAHVVVHYSVVGGKAVLKGLDWFGHGTVKVVEATVHYVKKDGKKVALAIAGGAEETFEVSEHALVKTGKVIGHGAKVAAKEVTKGTKATVHIVEHDGRKFVHFIEHI